MISIKLLGELGDLFISEFEAEITSASEAINCLSANFPDFLAYLAESAARGIKFCVKAGYQELEEDELGRPFSKKIQSFTITAIPQGSGGGFGKILLGVALIGAGFLSGGIGGIGFLGLSSNTLILTGASLLLSGIASLFGQTKAPKDDEDKGKRSLVFSGGANTITEGGRLSIVYGRHRCGLVVLSARVFSYQ